MVERVARAMFDADNATGVTWDDNTLDWERNQYRNLARAAIEAMRHPTDAMKAAATECADPGGDIPCHKIDTVWQAMLSAAD